jgi:hypothetical protein
MSDVVPRVDYHTAHKSPVAGQHPVDRFDTTGAYAGRLSTFVHDIATGILPADYLRCDVLVTDLPWRNGFDEFNRRAGLADGRSYLGFMRAVSAIVKGDTGAACPTYLITGRHALAYLPAPDVVLPMRLNQDDAVAIGYRPGAEAFADYGDSREFIRALADIYDCAGDFCCGYGRTARFFLRAGKAAVASDVNALCVGYVADHARGWLGV